MIAISLFSAARAKGMMAPEPNRTATRPNKRNRFFFLEAKCMGVRVRFELSLSEG